MATSEFTPNLHNPILGTPLEQSHVLNNKLQIRFWDDPVLQEVCVPVEESEFGEELFFLGQQMIEAMQTDIEVNGGRRILVKGIGLAAPQVGVAKRIFVMRLHDNSTIVAVNPEVEPYGTKVSHWEGCLSLPEVEEQVIRYDHCVLSYQDALTGERLTVDLGVDVPQGQRIPKKTYDAFCAMHEKDHLDGVMFFDRRRVSRQVNRSVERAWEAKRKELGV